MITKIQPQFLHKTFGSIAFGSINCSNHSNAPLNFSQTISDKDCFTHSTSPRLPFVQFEQYSEMSESEKNYFRKKCDEFHDTVNPKKLFDPEENYLPLSKKGQMEEFVDFSAKYNTAKGAPIICLGRSPKWPLSVSQWMKNGIDGYKFVAFSKSWYMRHIDLANGDSWLTRVNEIAPNSDDINAYRNYLVKIKADPKSIINSVQKAGKEAVITDYVETSKGMTSFLEMLSNFAEDQGVLNDFAKSIRFFVIGSTEYTNDRLFKNYDRPPIPRIILPETLAKVVPKCLWDPPYPKQERHLDLSKAVFEQMFVSKNTNDARCGWYPKELWTQLVPHNEHQRFNSDMSNFRTLLNFKILDYLDAHKLLRKM